MKRSLKWFSCICVAGVAVSCAPQEKKIMVSSGKDQSLTEGLMSESQLRSELMSYSDTASTRVNQVCDEIARNTKNLDSRSRANLEKLSFARLCVENAGQPQVVAGLSDMTFQVTMKARNAKRRADALRAAATRPATTQSVAVDLFDQYADQFEKIYKTNNDEIWYLAKRALPPETYDTLAISLEKWLDEHPDLRYATARTSELRPYVSGASANAFAFVDLKSTTDQIDRGMWIAQRMPDQMRWQIAQVILDAFKQVADEREATLRQVADEITRQRQASINDINKELTEHIDVLSAKIDQQRAKALEDGFAKLAAERENTIKQATANADQLVTKSIDRFFDQLKVVLYGVAAVIVVVLVIVVMYIRSRTSAKPS